MLDDSCQFQLHEEQELEDGWHFEGVLDLGPDHSRAIRLRLGWADYNLWSPSGADRPSDVATAVLSIFIASMEPSSIPVNLDAGLIRRVIPDADSRVSAMIRQDPHA